MAFLSVYYMLRIKSHQKAFFLFCLDDSSISSNRGSPLKEETQVETNHIHESTHPTNSSSFQLDSSPMEVGKADLDGELAPVQDFPNQNNNSSSILATTTANHRVESNSCGPNAKLRSILYRELRKPGKSEWFFVCFYYYACISSFLSNSPPQHVEM